MPIAIFLGVEGSLPRARSHPKTPMTTGVSTTTHSGLIDWKISAPRICVKPRSMLMPLRLVYSLANMVSVSPFWWNENQKKITTPKTASSA